MSKQKSKEEAQGEDSPEQVANRVRNLLEGCTTADGIADGERFTLVLSKNFIVYRGLRDLQDAAMHDPACKRALDSAFEGYIQTIVDERVVYKRV